MRIPTLLLALVLSAFSQTLEPGSAEAAIFGGLIGGIGAHGTVGGGVNMATSEHLMPGLEFSYIPLGTDAFRTGRYGPGLAVRSARAYDIHGNLHVRFARQDQWAPYALVGVGLLRYSEVASSEPGTGRIFIKDSDTRPAVNIGAGLRYYLTESWGLRPEFKVYASKDKFVRLSIGVFYQFR